MHPNTGLPTSENETAARNLEVPPRTHKNSPKTMDGMGFILEKLVYYSSVIPKFKIQLHGGAFAPSRLGGFQLFFGSLVAAAVLADSLI